LPPSSSARAPSPIAMAITRSSCVPVRAPLPAIRQPDKTPALAPAASGSESAPAAPQAPHPAAPAPPAGSSTWVSHPACPALAVDPPVSARPSQSAPASPLPWLFLSTTSHAWLYSAASSVTKPRQLQSAHVPGKLRALQPRLHLQHLGRRIIPFASAPGRVHGHQVLFALHRRQPYLQLPIPPPLRGLSHRRQPRLYRRQFKDRIPAGQKAALLVLGVLLPRQPAEVRPDLPPESDLL
jgi:hypothetical protein